METIKTIKKAGLNLKFDPKTVLNGIADVRLTPPPQWRKLERSGACDESNYYL